MKTIGFYVGHVNYFAHAEQLIASIYKNIQNLKISVMVNRQILPEQFKNAKVKIKKSFEDVEFVVVDIPKHLIKLPFADKLFAAARFESQCQEDYIWIDVDSYFLKPVSFEHKKGVQLNPVDEKNIGIDYGEPISGIWKPIYKHFDLNRKIEKSIDIDKPHMSIAVRTTVSNTLIYPYFNIGFVIAHENKRVFQNAILALESLLMHSEVQTSLHAKPADAIFIHQAVFSAAVLKCYDLEYIEPLSPGLNYPLHLLDQNCHPLMASDIKHMRYDNYFETHKLPEALAANSDIQTESLRMTWYY